MFTIARRAAFRAPRVPIRAAARRTYAEHSAASPTNIPGESVGKEQVDLKKGAKRDPELYVLLAIMTGIFSLAGWHFSRNPTTASSENKVAKAADSEPWKTGSDAKYQYHPHGDLSATPRDAPSALNEVVIPNVNLPKELHDKYNKWGKEGY